MCHLCPFLDGSGFPFSIIRRTSRSFQDICTAKFLRGMAEDGFRIPKSAIRLTPDFPLFPLLPSVQLLFVFLLSGSRSEPALVVGNRPLITDY
jgi:hypothetical protein